MIPKVACSRKIYMTKKNDAEVHSDHTLFSSLASFSMVCLCLAYAQSAQGNIGFENRSMNEIQQ